MTDKISRKQQILFSLVEMLGENQGGKITTAKLAEKVGVTEAALYRHFPSKAKMFEALIEFVEETIFPRVHQIKSGDGTLNDKSKLIVDLLLTFAERNPGICRLLTGEVLMGERPALRQQIAQFFERLETELRQLIREAELNESLSLKQTAGVSANFISSIISGHINHYVRSGFSHKVMQSWQQQSSLVELY